MTLKRETGLHQSFHFRPEVQASKMKRTKLKTILIGVPKTPMTRNGQADGTRLQRVVRRRRRAHHTASDEPPPQVATHDEGVSWIGQVHK